MSAQLPDYWIGQRLHKGWRLIHGKEKCAGRNADPIQGIMGAHGTKAHICKKCLGAGQGARETMRALQVHRASVELVPEPVDRLQREAQNVVVFIGTLFACLCWLIVGWGWEGAASIALAVFVYRRMFRG